MSDTSTITKRGFSPREAAEATGLSLATINRGIRDGTIPSKKFKDRRIISSRAIDALVEPPESETT